MNKPIACLVVCLAAAVFAQTAPDGEAKAAAQDKEACDGGNGQACTSLGLRHAHGDAGVPKDDKIANQFYERGCTLGDGRACLGLGFNVSRGVGAARSRQRANELYQRGCDSGFAPACENLSGQYEGGGETAEDWPRAVSLLQRACALDSGNACDRLAAVQEQGLFGVHADADVALPNREKACTLGVASSCTRGASRYQQQREQEKANAMLLRGCRLKDAKSCYALGVNEVNGRGDLYDFPGGVAHFTEACQLKYPNACTNLGNNYALGRGIAYDPIKAMQFYKDGCDLKDPAACKLLETYPPQFVDLSRESCRVDRVGNGCHNLGLAYLAGIGVPVDREKARELFAKSCDLGDRGGCNRLAEMYTGEGGEPADWAKVYAIYEKQCADAGDGAACNELGYYVESGKGGKADAARALALYQRGCGLDDYASCENLASTYDAKDKVKAKELSDKAAAVKTSSAKQASAAH